MNWYKKAQSDPNNPSIPASNTSNVPYDAMAEFNKKIQHNKEIQEMRVLDVKRLLEESNEPMTTRDMLPKLQDISGERWSVYYKDSRRMIGHLLSALSVFKNDLVIGEVRKHHRGRGVCGLGGMGTVQRFKTYILKSKIKPQVNPV